MTRYWTRVLIGLAICGASIVGISWGLYHLTRTGSCASGGNYISARPCPPGTGGHILAVIGGAFGAFIGIGVYAMRGKAGRPARLGIGFVMWALVFVAVTAAVLVSAFGPANDSGTGARTTALVLAPIFLSLGLLPLRAFSGFSGRRQQVAMQLASTGKRCPGVVVSVDDTGVTVNDNPNVQMTVRAEPPGEAPFTIVKSAVVSRVKIPRAGDRCVVFYDPSNPQGVNGITFDEVPGFAPVGAAPPTAGAEEEHDPLDRIAKLGELRDRGLISPEEFEAQKKRLLDEV